MVLDGFCKELTLTVFTVINHNKIFDSNLQKKMRKMK